MNKLRSTLPLYFPALFACLFVAAWNVSSIAQEKNTGLPYTISRQTTHFTGPLKENGDLDFFAVINERHGDALSLESNAAVLLLPILDLEGAPLAPMLERVGLRDAEIEHRPIVTLPDNLTQDFKEATKGIWTAAKYPELADWVKTNSFALEAIRAAGKRPIYQVPFPSSDGLIAGCIISDVHSMRRVGRLMLAQTTLALSDEEIEQAVEDIKTIQRLVDQLGNGDCVIISLVGMKLHERSSDAMAAVAGSDAQLMAGEWRQIREAWGQRDRLLNVDVLDICERAMVLDLMTWVARNGASERVHRVFGDVDILLKTIGFRLLKKKLDGIENWDSVIAKTSKYFDQAVLAWEMEDTVKRTQAINELTKSVEKEREAFKSNTSNIATIAAASAESLASGYFATFLPIPFDRVNNTELRRLNEHRIVWLALALQEFHQNEGRFPGSLADLPGVEASDYRDLFSGDAYDYEADENGYRLRTAGPDLKFDADESLLRDRENSDDWGIRLRLDR